MPLVRAFQDALAATGGGQVIAVDANPLAASLYVADAYEILPPADGPALADALLDLCRRRGVRLLVPTRDEELAPLAAQRDVFAAAGTLAMVAAPEVIDVCQDKQKFVRFCGHHGFPTPALLDPDALEDADFPVFGKPRRGKAGVGAGPIMSRADLQHRRSHDPDLMVQQLVRAPEYTIDVFSDFDSRVISVVPRLRVRVVDGESTIGCTRNHAGLIDEASRLAQTLGLVGHNTLQCFFDEITVSWIEVNARFGGAANLGFAAGAPTPRWLIQLARGETVASRIGEFTDGLYMFRHSADVFVRAQELAGDASL